MKKTTKSKPVTAQYQDYSSEDAEKDAEGMSSGSIAKLKPGVNKLRIVPGMPGKSWKRVVYRHFVDVPGGGVAAFVCPRHETRGKRGCSTCDRAAKLDRTGDPVDERLAFRIRAQRKVMFNAVSRDNVDAGPRTYEVGVGIERELTDMRRLEDVNFVNPEGGSDIVIIKKGEQLKTRYKVKEGDQCRLHESGKVMREWITNQPDLEAHVQLESDEEIEAKLRGEDRRGDDDDRRGSRGKGKSKGKRRDEDDEDDLDMDSDADLDVEEDADDDADDADDDADDADDDEAEYLEL